MTAIENRPADGEAASEEFRGSKVNFNTSDKPGSAVRTPAFAPTSEETLVERVVSTYLTRIVDDTKITLGEIRDALLQRLNAEFSLENTARKAVYSTSPTIQKMRVLDEQTVVKVLLARYRIVAIDLTEGEDDDMTLLAMYVEFGDDEGIYTTSEGRIKALASELKPSMNSRAIDSVYASLGIHAPVVLRTMEPHLIPVGNGVFDHARQTLRPFSPDWIFLSKIPTTYDPNAKSPEIKMPDGLMWNVDSWIESLSDDEGVSELLWEVISAAVRSDEPWNKALWLVAERGNNGKGTYIQFIRNILGPKSCASVKFADFGHEFKMEPLIKARVNLVDENGVGDFTERIENYKAAVTGDVFLVNRKHKKAVGARFRGFDIQCFNSTTPRTKDRTDSFYRRLLIVLFNKWFGGAERKYIKSDYLGRPEVLRYALKRALEMQHKELSNPMVCQDALDAYRGNNNMLMSFWREFEPDLKWSLVPFRFLHDLYREWFRQTNPSGQPESLNSLVSFLREHLAGSQKWEHKGSTAIRPGTLMSLPEPLIVEYDLRDWKNAAYTGTDPLKTATTSPLKANYKGLKRRPPVALTAPSQLDKDSTS
jgi:putative DNA primase/helicase